MCKVALLDNGFRPDRTHQFFFFDNVAVLLDQCQQQVKRFGRERERMVRAEENPLHAIKAEWAKLVEVLG